MLTGIKNFLSILPIVGPYFDSRFSQSNELEVDQTPSEGPTRRHADWASEQIAVPSLRVVFPDEAQDEMDEILEIQRIAEKLGVDNRDLEDGIFELKRGKRLIVIPQREKGIKVPVFEMGIDIHEIAEELRNLINPNEKKEFFTVNQINVNRQFKLFQSIASALGQELDIVIHEHEIGLRRSGRLFDNGGVGVFIFQDEPVLKSFRIGTFRVPARLQVVGTG